MPQRSGCGATSTSARSARGPDARARYHKRKWSAEERVRAAAADWTIFRPSVIFGEQCDYIKTMEILVRLPVVSPMLGSGLCRIQPIYVHDVAGAVCDALVDPETLGKTYHLGGPEVLTMDEVLTLLEQRSRKKKIAGTFRWNPGRLLSRRSVCSSAGCFDACTEILPGSDG